VTGFGSKVETDRDYHVTIAVTVFGIKFTSGHRLVILSSHRLEPQEWAVRFSFALLNPSSNTAFIQPTNLAAFKQHGSFAPIVKQIAGSVLA
jgi:hypothetical protein